MRELERLWVSEWEIEIVCEWWVIEFTRERERDSEIDWWIKRVGEWVSASKEQKSESMIDWLSYWMSEGLSD